MESIFTFITTITLLCMTSLASARSRENSCAIYSGGCAFHVVMVGKDCQVNDIANSYVQNKPETASHSLQGDDPKALYGYQVDPSHNDINKEQLHLDKVVRDEMQTNSKRLAELDTKLTNMMEGLSVRSLRHFRKIKTDMDSIMETVKTMTKQDGGKNGRSERSPDRCPPEFMTVGTWDSCYRFSNFNDSWSEAKEYCSAFGASLVGIETEKEAYILDGLIKSNPELQMPKGWWTAGNYVARTQQWVWSGRRHAKPFEKTNYLRWDENEPNARSTMHCMLMYRPAEYRWHDGMCTDKHNFICEIPVNH